MNLTDLLKTLEAEVSAENLLQLTEKVWQLDRRFSYPAFAESAAFEAEKMRSWGIEAEVLEAPADGDTVIGDWRMPLAWDYERAVLEIVAPEKARRALADTAALPTHIVMWSGPTPADGLTAPLVYVPAADKAEAYNGRNVAGKILLTDTEARACKMQAVQHGAVALASFYSPQPAKLPAAVFWVNGWSDDPGGWAFHDGDTALPAMSIAPAAGAELVKLLEAEPEVRVRMSVRSRYYKGVMPLATGLYRGRSSEEVLALGHGQEPGANDNASGAAVMLEAQRAVKALVESGRLARPERSIRVLITNECYGTLAFAAMKPEVIRRTIAGINIDSVGHDLDRSHSSFRVLLNPHASTHFSDTLLCNLFESYLKRRRPGFALQVQPFGLDDNIIADPAYGVPTPFVGGKDVNWHTSADTMDKINPDNISTVCVITAAYLYAIAAGGEEEARAWSAEAAARWLKSGADSISASLISVLAASGEERARKVTEMRQYAAYTADLAAAELASTRRLVKPSRLPEYGGFLAELRGATRDALLRVSEGAARAARLVAEEEGEPLDAAPTEAMNERMVAAEELIPVRRFKGTPAYDSLPAAIRRQARSPRWHSGLHVACFWMDGKRTLAEAVRLAALETGGKPLALLDDIDFMVKHGLIELKPKNA